MHFAEFISTNQVFTTQTLLEKTGDSPSVPVALSRAVKSGRVIKVRTGLYVSQSGRFQGVRADPYLIASAFKPDAVFTHHSALALHGLAHSVFNHVQFMTNSTSSSFSYDGLEYKNLPIRQNARIEVLHARLYGSASVTTREQSLVDCMAKIKLAGGAEEVIRSFAGLPYADISVILLCLEQYPPSVASRIGWYLEANQERWSVSRKALVVIESMISQKGSYKLDPTYKHFEAYNKRWRLSLPASEETIESWMEF